MGYEVEGCPRLDSTIVTIIASTTGESSETACNSYTWEGTEYTTSDDYEKTFTNAAGCDSVHTLHLTINYSNT
ncbi:MAG: hypothetical protein HQ522_00095, partial [Bacteroidetes bacterium]|nr:hypothetical protein [Bacteroidota bacterium]